jgi:hypothetical protein
MLTADRGLVTKTHMIVSYTQSFTGNIFMLAP